MPYALIAGILGAVGYFVTFYICKFFFRSFFEERRETLVFVCFLTSFVVSFGPTYWMQLNDKAILAEMGLTEARYNLLQERFADFLEAPQNEDLKAKILESKRSNYVIDGREVLWQAALSGVPNLSNEDLTEWRTVLYKLGKEGQAENCGRIFLGNFDSSELFQWVTALSDSALDDFLDIFFKTVSARHQTTSLRITDPQRTEEVWIKFQKYFDQSFGQLKANIEAFKKGELDETAACASLKRLLDLKPAMDAPSFGLIMSSY